MSRWLYVRSYIAFVLAASLVVPTMMFIELDVPHWYVGIILVMSLVSALLIILGLQDTPIDRCPRCASEHIEKIHVEHAIIIMLRCSYCGECWHPME